MTDLVPGLGAAWLTGVLLVSTRIAALFLMTPVLHAVPLPTPVRVLLAFGLSVALALPFAGAAGSAVPTSGELAQAFLSELALGATLGLGILMAFSGFTLAGRLLDVQVGFGVGQVFDPVTRAQIPVLTSVFTLFGVLLFFLVDGHHALLRGVGLSLERFPVGRPWPLAASAEPILRQAAGLFTLGFALAAPVVMCVLLVEFGLGVVARNLPQVNMFVLGIPVKIIAGLLALSFWTGGMGAVTLRLYGEIYRTWTGLFALPGPASGAAAGGR